MPPTAELTPQTRPPTEVLGKSRALPAAVTAAELQGYVAGRSASFRYSLQLLAVGTPLWLADLLASSVALTLSFAITSGLGKEVNHFPAFAVCAVLAKSLCFWSAGLYPGVGWHPARELQQLFKAAVTAALVLAVGLLLVSSWNSPYVWMVGIGLPLELCLLPPFRSLAKSIMRRAKIGVPFYFLGNRHEIMRVYRDMSRFGWTMLVPQGRFADLEHNGQFGKLTAETAADEFEWRFEQNVRYSGTPDRLLPMAKQHGVFWLFVVAEDPGAKLADLKPCVFNVFPQVICMRSSRTHACSGSSLVSYGLTSGVRIQESLLLPWPRFLKRALDVAVAGTALFALLPVIIVLSLLVRLSGPGPIFFSHERIGRGGQAFRAWKFRSMVSNANEILAEYLDRNPEYREEWEQDHKLKNDPRITWIGRLLRKTSLDELPQLWNVLVGEMSLVGPRPIVEDEIAKYGNTFRDYLRVTPGITGLWQISGRNNTTYAERLAYDEFYVRHWSPWLDLYILLRTVKTVLLCEGAY